MLRKTSAIALAIALTPALAHAHTGAGSVHGFMNGLNHPIHGLDHLLAMIAVGLWAAQLGGRALWAVPAIFVGVMAVGGAMGMAGLQLPMVETGILTSVFLLGLLIAFAVRLPLWASMTIVGVFSLFHGFAHGAEMPEQASSLLYASGFILVTAALHTAGIGLGIALKNVSFAPVLRLAGAAVILGGLFIALS